MSNLCRPLVGSQEVWQWKSSFEANSPRHEKASSCEDSGDLVVQSPGTRLTPDQSTAVATLIRQAVEQFLSDDATPGAAFSRIKFLLDADRSEKLAAYGA